MQLTKSNTIKLAIMTALAVPVLVLPVSVVAGGVTYKDGDNYLKVGGRIQLQYHQVKPDGGSSTDDLFFSKVTAIYRRQYAQRLESKNSVGYG